MESMDIENNEDNEKQFGEGLNDADTVVKRTALKTIGNRNPSMIVDPDTVRKEKRLKKRMKFTTTFLWIIFSISVLSLILLIVQWSGSSG